jgi:hypothetical protein
MTLNAAIEINCSKKTYKLTLLREKFSNWKATPNVILHFYLSKQNRSGNSNPPSPRPNQQMMIFACLILTMLKEPVENRT